MDHASIRYFQPAVSRIKAYLFSARLVDPLSLLAAVLIGIFIYSSLTRFGIGVSSDAVSYFLTAFNVAAGHGWFGYDNAPYTWWPPLYPALLAGLHLLTGADLVNIAFWVNVATFAGIVLSTWWLARQFFASQPALVFWSVLMAAGAQMMVAPAQNAGSDYLAALLAVLGLLAADRYIRKPGRVGWAWLFVFGMLSALQRYIGVTVVAMAGFVILVYGRGSFLRRMASAAAQGLALVPLAIWAWHNIQAGTGPFGPRIPATSSLGKNFQISFEVILRWFFSASTIDNHPFRSRFILQLILVVLALTFVTGLVVFLVRGKQVFQPLTWPVFFYAVLFPLALVINASLAWFKAITDRFFVPAYIPMMLVAFLALDFILRWLMSKLNDRFSRLLNTGIAALVPLLILWTGFAGSISLVQASRSEGVLPDNLYHNAQWNNIPLIDAARQLLADHPDAVLYSNQPQGVAFFTWHTAYWSPFRNDAIFKEQKYPLGDFSTAFAHCTDSCYLVWKLPHPYDHLYLLDDLSRIARLDVIFQSPGGVIYQISRR